MSGIFLLLGTNLGDKLQNLNIALSLLQKTGISVAQVSSVYDTAAWGKEDQERFLNLAAKVDTSLSPLELLKALQEVERTMGRIRLEKWGSRVIDIDILYYHDLVVNEPHLTVPHPGIPHRLFTLLPLSQLDPHGIHPQLLMTNNQLKDLCPDPLECLKTTLSLSYDFH